MTESVEKKYQQKLIHEIIFVDSCDFGGIPYCFGNDLDWFLNKLEEAFKVSPIVENLSEEIFDDIKNTIYNNCLDNDGTCPIKYTTNFVGVRVTLNNPLDISNLFGYLYEYDANAIGYDRYKIFHPVTTGSEDFTIINTFFSNSDPRKIIFNIKYTR